MKIGYPCINLGFACRPSKTFRLASYSDELLQRTVENNLACLDEILKYNVEHHLLFFRLTSDLIPFASHPVCTFRWQEHFAPRFAQSGAYIRNHHMRISLHPDQFTLINSPDETILKRSEAELRYHAEILELMGLDRTAKIQIHAGGVYGDKKASLERFVRRWHQLDQRIRDRLVVENDDRSYTLADCLMLNDATGIPVLFDVFHHAVNSSGESVLQAMERAAATWRMDDGIPMVDYSVQKPGARKGSHADSIDPEGFARFLEESSGVDFDVMLEIKDKERSALRAVEIARDDPRLERGEGAA